MPGVIPPWEDTNEDRRFARASLLERILWVERDHHAISRDPFPFFLCDWAYARLFATYRQLRRGDK